VKAPLQLAKPLTEEMQAKIVDSLQLDGHDTQRDLLAELREAGFLKPVEEERRIVGIVVSEVSTKHGLELSLAKEIVYTVLLRFGIPTHNQIS
jgi:hypothetical protein